MATTPETLKLAIKAKVAKQDKFAILDELNEFVKNVKPQNFSKFALGAFYKHETLTEDKKTKLLSIKSYVKKHEAALKAKLLPFTVIGGQTDTAVNMAIEKLFYATKTYTKKDEETVRQYVNMYKEDLAEYSYTAIKKAVDYFCSPGKRGFPELSEFKEQIEFHQEFCLMLLADVNFILSL